MRLHIHIALASAALVATVYVAAFAADEPIELVFKIDSRPITLSDEVRIELRDQADLILRHCAYDGGDHEERVWLEALAEPSSIRLTYATPIQIKLLRREILVSDAVFSLGEPEFLGSPVLHHEGRTSLVFKCDGTNMLELMCMPELAAYFPANYQINCQIVRGE